MCDFEEDDLCNWVNSESNDFDWRLTSGQSSDINSEPLFDHTLSNMNGHYIYIDSSQPSKPGWKAQLISEPQLDKFKGCIYFWYYLWGSVK